MHFLTNDFWLVWVTHIQQEDPLWHKSSGDTEHRGLERVVDWLHKYVHSESIASHPGQKGQLK